MKKSLLLTFDFPPKHGGISFYLSQICSSLPAEKILVVTERSGSTDESPYKVFRYRLLQRWLWPHWLLLPWRVFQICRREKIQLLQVGQLLPFGTIALLMKKILRLPFIVYVYGQDLIIERRSLRKTSLVKRILANAETVIACSNYTRQLAESFGADPHRTIVMYPYPNQYPHSTSQMEKQEAKEKLGYIGKKVILSVGNLVKRKGHAIALQAVAQSLATVPNLHYCIVGNGPELNSLKALTRRLGIQDHVSMFPDIGQYKLSLFYQASDIFILLSRILYNSHREPVDAEGFGIVFLEASGYGLPVIAGNSGGVPEAVAGNFSGLLVNPESVADAASAIQRLCADEQLAKRLGEQGRDRAINQCQWFQEVKKITPLLT